MSQETHDRKVRQVVRNLLGNAWKVQAGVKGLDRPAGIGERNHIPDIVAKKSGATMIVEVDTPDSVDESQIATFKRSAARRSRTRFVHVVVKPRNKKGSR